MKIKLKKPQTCCWYVGGKIFECEFKFLNLKKFWIPHLQQGSKSCEEILFEHVDSCMLSKHIGFSTEIIHSATWPTCQLSTRNTCTSPLNHHRGQNRWQPVRITARADDQIKHFLERCGGMFFCRLRHRVIYYARKQQSVYFLLRRILLLGPIFKIPWWIVHSTSVVGMITWRSG